MATRFENRLLPLRRAGAPRSDSYLDDVRGDNQTDERKDSARARRLLLIKTVPKHDGKRTASIQPSDIAVVSSLFRAYFHQSAAYTVRFRKKRESAATRNRLKVLSLSSKEKDGDARGAADRLSPSDGLRDGLADPDVS